MSRLARTAGDGGGGNDPNSALGLVNVALLAPAKGI
jgi:hypothetical protein